MKPKITFVLTGGTFDKEYDALDRPFTIGNGAVKRILDFVNPNFEATIVSFTKKVSVDITKKDMAHIKKTCSTHAGDRIVIVYGTDAMVGIGEHLKSIKNKTIVITGSLKSQLVKNTDAEFNLGFAVAAAQTLPYGTYIAMSGRIYSWDACKKNMKTGQFVEK